MDGSHPKSHELNIIVVGSGIAGLMSAFHAAMAGYRVTVLSKSPDPRVSAPKTKFDSSTWDGYVNRYITLTEGHPYLDLPGYISVMYPDIGQDFRTSVEQGGMLAIPREQFGSTSRQFLLDRERANADHDATFRLFLEYVDENRASMEMWYRLLAGAMTPDLAKRVSLHVRGIDRFYDESHLFDGAASFQADQNILKGRYSKDELREGNGFACYRNGIDRHGFIRGGGLTVYGLAFDVQAFCRDWLLNRLEELGVRFRLGLEFEVVELERNERGAVKQLRTRSGDSFAARHFLMQPGAYIDPNTLRGTSAEGKIAGVKGLWMRVRDAQNIFDGTPPRPNKIHGGKYEVRVADKRYTGQVADLNVMPKYNSDGSWELVIGSGYLFVGTYPFDDGFDQDGSASDGRPLTFAEELAFRAFSQIVERVYDLKIDVEAVLTGRDAQIDIPAPGCVRSWTPDDRELHVLLPTEAGGVCLIEGGGNTGSTTKAPFLSRVSTELLKTVDQCPEEYSNLDAQYAKIRRSFRKTKDQLQLDDWAALERDLNFAVSG